MFFSFHFITWSKRLIVSCLEPISKLFEVLDTILRVRHYSHSDFMMRTSKDTLGHYHSSRMTKGDVTRRALYGLSGTCRDRVWFLASLP